MKTLKIMWFAILMLVIPTLQAQVVETYRNSYKDYWRHYVSKHYMAELDSMVYVPAQNWDITKLAVENYYADDAGEVHVVARIAVGPDAHLAKVAIGNDLSPVDIANDSVPTVNLTAGTEQSVDLVIANPSKRSTIFVVTKNRYHGWDYDWRLYYKSIAVDYNKWVESLTWTAWCNNAAEFEAAGGVGEWPLGEVGTGTYTFTQVLSGTLPGVRVEFRQNKVDGTCQFRFLDLATSYFPKWTEVVMEATWMEDLGVYMLRLPQTYTGYIFDAYDGDELFVADYLSYFELRGQTVPWDTWADLSPEMQSWYNPSTGLFNLSVIYAISLGYFGTGIETCQMNGFDVSANSRSAVYDGMHTGEDGKIITVLNVDGATKIVLPSTISIGSRAATSSLSVSNLVPSGKRFDTLQEKMEPQPVETHPAPLR